MGIFGNKKVVLNSWNCPCCGAKNNKRISSAMLVTCKSCHERLGLDGENIVTFKKRFGR